MKVIILSCNTGEGHNTAGNAIIEGMRARGVEADMVNALELMGVKRSKLICGTYIKMVRKLPALFGFIYNLALLTSTHRFKSVLYYVNKPSQDKLYDYIVENDYDTVVLPHLFPAETITSIRKNKAITNFKCYAIATDYTCIPFWEDLEMDGIVIGHKSQLGEMVERGLDPKLLAPLGIPVSAKFAKAYDKAETRAKLGLGDAERIYLIMTGSMGFGNISAILTPLLSACGARDRVVVLGGRNEKLKSSLRAKYESERKLQVVDFTTEVERYMAACDVLFTKPGGLSTSEAATMGVPLIHTKPIPGVESRNAVFFSSLGMSIYEKNVPAMVRRAVELAGDEARGEAAERSADLVAARGEPLARHSDDAALHAGQLRGDLDIVRHLLEETAGLLGLVLPRDAEEIQGIHIPQADVLELSLNFLRDGLRMLHLRDGRNNDVVFLGLLNVVLQAGLVDGQIDLAHGSLLLLLFVNIRI